MGCLRHLRTHADLSETLLLISIHVHTKLLSPITDIICGLLGLRISLRRSPFLLSMLWLPVLCCFRLLTMLSLAPDALSALGAIFSEELYPEAAVAQAALALPLTPELAAGSPSQALNCVYHLLKGTLLRFPVPPFLTLFLISLLQASY